MTLSEVGAINLMLYINPVVQLVHLNEWLSHLWRLEFEIKGNKEMNDIKDKSVQKLDIEMSYKS